MAKDQTFVIRAMSEIGKILRELENAQAYAAATLQHFGSVGGDDYLDDVSWNDADVDEDDFKDAMLALPYLATILDSGSIGTSGKTIGEALYLVKS